MRVVLACGVLLVSARIAPAHPRCTETDPVLGYQRCSRFGAWSALAHMPPLALEIGATMHGFPSVPFGETTTYRATSGTGMTGRYLTGAVQFRLTASLFGPIYVGTESDWGAVASGPSVIVEHGEPESVTGTGAYFAARGMAGARLFVDASTTLGAEVAGGFRMVSYGFGPADNDGAARMSVGEARTEAQVRARVERWLSPWVSINASLATSVVDRGDWQMAVGVAGHLRAFDARR
jgi:hypothetical protein